MRTRITDSKAQKTQPDLALSSFPLMRPFAPAVPHPSAPTTSLHFSILQRLLDTERTVQTKEDEESGEQNGNEGNVSLVPEQNDNQLELPQNVVDLVGNQNGSENLQNNSAIEQTENNKEQVEAGNKNAGSLLSPNNPAIDLLGTNNSAIEQT